MRSKLLPYVPPLAAAFLLRAISLARFLEGSPFARRLFSDGHAYWERAGAILSGGMPREPFYQAPLYPFFVALYRAAAGNDPRLLYAVQHGLGILSVLLVTAIAARSLPRRSAAAAGLFFALLPYPVYLEQKLVPLSFALPLALGALLLLLRAGRGRGWAAAGAAAGAASLARANLLLFAALAAVWAYRRGGARAAILFGAAAAALVLPVTVWNAAAGGGFVPVAANGGEVFYHGNNPNAAGAMGRVPEFRADILTLPAETRAAAARALGRPVNAAAASRHWFGRGLSWIVRNPAAALRLEARKARILLSGRFTPIGNFFDFEADRFPGVPRSLAFLHYPLLLLALLGLAGPARRRVPGPVLLFGAVQAATVLLFFGCTRYALPLAPVLALLAGAALAGPRPRLPLLAAAAAATLLLLVTDLRWEREWAAPHAQLGSIRLAEERGEEAVALFEEAARIAPEEVIHVQNLARAIWFTGYPDRAAERIVRARERGIADGRTLGYLGALYFELERYDEAEEALRASLRLDPERALTMFYLGRVFVRQRRWAEAERAFLEAVEREPDMLDAHRHLYRIYQGPLRDREKMEREKRKVLELHGWD